jgi:hypothetical protein
MTERVVSEVMEVYENLYTFLLQPHVWKWGVIDALDSVTRAYKKP